MYLLLALFIAARLHPVEAPIGSMRRTDLVAAFTRVYGRSLADKELWWSSLFFGTTYHLDPLGEGPDGRYDSDPLLVYDRVDCLSYVQLVMALSLSDGPDQVVPWLLEIRYEGGKPRFSKRYYTMTKGWIAAMVRKGLLEDVTRKVGGGAVSVAELDLDRRTAWNRSTLRRFRLLGPLAPSGQAAIPYLPVRAIEKLAGNLPPIMIAHIVRKPVASSPYLVSHTGFVVVQDGKLWFRHASRSPGHRKVEQRPFADYAEGLVRFVGRRGWRPVLGLNLTVLHRPGPDRLRLSVSGREGTP